MTGATDWPATPANKPAVIPRRAKRVRGTSSVTLAVSNSGARRLTGSLSSPDTQPRKARTSTVG